MECWDFRKCSPKTRMGCSAYPDNGRRCWKVTGTKCDGGRIEKASLKEKIFWCSQCEFYRTYAEKF